MERPRQRLLREAGGVQARLEGAAGEGVAAGEDVPPAGEGAPAPLSPLSPPRYLEGRRGLPGRPQRHGHSLAAAAQLRHAHARAPPSAPDPGAHWLRGAGAARWLGGGSDWQRGEGAGTVLSLWLPPFLRNQSLREYANPLNCFILHCARFLSDFVLNNLFRYCESLFYIKRQHVSCVIYWRYRLKGFLNRGLSTDIAKGL